MPTLSSPMTWKASSPSCTASATGASTDDRRRVLRLLVKDVLIGPEKITIRHRIPIRPASSGTRQRDTTTHRHGG